MLKQLNQLIEFHKAFGHPVLYDINEISSISVEDFKKLLKLRANLIQEESKEVCAELEKNINLEDTAKELADLCYVVFGTIISLGLQNKFEDIFNEVHRSNMSKLTKEGKVLRREDGKVLKSDQYSPADINKILY